MDLLAPSAPTRGPRSRLERGRSRTAYTNAWVPGRVIGGIAMVVGPLLWLAALVLRYLGFRLATFTPEQAATLAGQPFAAPGQLAAYAQHPRLVTAGYALFAAACIVLAFAVLTLARLVATASPVLAHLAAICLVASMFGRLYFSGVDLTAFRLVDAVGLDQATRFVMEDYVALSYGLWYIPVTAAAGALVGGGLLALAAFRAGQLGLLRCVLLLGWAGTFLGVLKESDTGSVVGALWLCVVVVPFGIQLLRDRIPDLRTATGPGSVEPRRLHWLW